VSRKRVAVALITTLSVAAVLLTLSARPELERYTTPPLDARGTRIELLVPTGWVPYTQELGPRSDNSNMLHIITRKAPDWMPVWLRPFLHHEEYGYVAVTWSARQHSGMPKSWTHSVRHERQKDRFDIQAGGSAAGRGEWSVTYCRDNRDTFERTQRAVVKSVKIN
jgi:hypothetical protein